MANQNVRRRLSDTEMNRGIGMLEAGSNQREVARILGVSQGVFGRLWHRYQTHGNVMHRHGGSRTRSTTQAQDALSSSKLDGIVSRPQQPSETTFRMPLTQRKLYGIVYMMLV